METNGYAVWASWTGEQVASLIDRKFIRNLLVMGGWSIILLVLDMLFVLTHWFLLLLWVFIFIPLILINYIQTRQDYASRASMLVLRGAALWLCDYERGFCSDCPIGHLRRKWDVLERAGDLPPHFVPPLSPPCQ